MAAPVFGRTGLDRDAHLGFGRSVLPIAVYLTRQRKAGENIDLSQPIEAIPGVVTVSTQHFCHITALAFYMFRKPRSLYRFGVMFPNGAIVPVNMDDVRRRDRLAAFFVRVPPGAAAEEVQFSDVDILENLPMRSFGHFMSPFPPVRIQSHLSDGFVIRPNAGPGFFLHDCTPCYATCQGSALFDNQQRLVGVSCEDEGLTRAITVGRIRNYLSLMYQLDDMTMFEIIQHLKGLGATEVGNM